MADTRGVFSLIEIVPIKLEEGWVPLSDVWVAPSPLGIRSNYVTGLQETLNTGYFGGGDLETNPSSITVSSMEKVNYSSDTTASVPSANLRYYIGRLAATGNLTNGYFGGGGVYFNAVVSTVHKVTYSTDITQQSGTAALSNLRYRFVATGNLTAGYFGGGAITPGPSIVVTVDKVTYSTDTRTTPPTANLSAARYALAATGNQTAGYFGGGGLPSSGSSRMDKLTYSTDTTVYTPTANLTANRNRNAATGSLTAGYFSGGNGATTDKLTYSSDTTAASPTANLSAARQYLSASGNSTNGYFAGGYGPLSTMEKIIYSSDTRVLSPTANLNIGRACLAASSARANAFSPTVDAPGSTPTSGTFPIPSTAPNTGYFGGGAIPTAVSRMDKVTYSTDTTAYTPTANLNAPRSAHAATGNQAAGYFGGGGPAQTTMEKVDYSSDTTTYTPTANLRFGRGGLGATGNSTAGYFGGESPAGSTMEKVSYSTNTTITTPSAFLAPTRSNLAATGNTTAGYFSGGGPTPANKLNYSTDTIANIFSVLSSSKIGTTATGNSTAGYFAGGHPAPSNGTKMDKITYSTDTGALVPTATLNIAKGRLAATGNSTAGYFGGGSTSPTGPISPVTVDKLTYSSDTTAATPTANLSAARDYLAASSAGANALSSSYIAPTPNLV
jgi:hypothetical protein